MPDLATAYVQIVPSAKGIKSSLTEELDGAAQQAGQSAGEKISGGIGNALGTLGKVGATALAGTTAAVGALSGAALSAYGDYEQLTGGVETLFKGSADTVKGYAENAYANAGMSANEYMETVTGFSASLIQSLGGDTEKAAQVANVAITDMADNSNKMGTSMESIQYAYQGFAKQNYTMLDNLKLGYGGTKEEMQRLLSDAEKLPGAMGRKFDLSNYSDVVEAIHLVQENMGITGATANEAATTIQGSLGMMKGAWSNLVAGLGNENANLDALIGNLVTSFSTAADNIMPRITQIITSIGSMADQIVPVIAEQIPALINENLPAMLDAGMSLLQGLISGIMQALPQLTETAVNVLTQFCEFLLQNLPLIVEGALQIIVTLAEGISQALPELIPVIVDVVLEIVDTLIDNIPMLVDAALDLITGLAEGIIKAIPVVVDKIPELIGSIIDALLKSAPEITEAGVTLLVALVENLPEIINSIVQVLPDIIDSIVTTLLDNIDYIIDAGVDLLTSLVQDLPEIIDTLMGKMPDIINGFITGLMENIDDIVQAGVDLLTALIQNIPEIISGITMHIPEIVVSIANAFIDNIGEIISAGTQLIQGLWQGISDAAGWLWDKISGFASQVVQKIKDFFGIHSPSKEMAFVGEMLAAGLSEGITDNTGEAVKAAEGMAKEVAGVNFGLNPEGLKTEAIGYALGDAPGREVYSMAASVKTPTAETAGISNAGELEQLLELLQKYLPLCAEREVAVPVDGIDSALSARAARRVAAW